MRKFINIILNILTTIIVIYKIYDVLSSNGTFATNGSLLIKIGSGIIIIVILQSIKFKDVY